MTNYTFTPSELPVGSMVNHFRSEMKIDLSDLKFLKEHPVEFNEVYEPIPLTPEVMERCGFECSKEVVEEDEVTVWSLWNMEFTFDNYGALINQEYHLNVNRPKYLHQLQNVMFVNTGQKLNVKP